MYKNICPHVCTHVLCILAMRMPSASLFRLNRQSVANRYGQTCAGKAGMEYQTTMMMSKVPYWSLSQPQPATNTPREARSLRPPHVRSTGAKCASPGPCFLAPEVLGLFSVTPPAWQGTVYGILNLEATSPTSQVCSLVCLPFLPGGSLPLASPC